MVLMRTQVRILKAMTSLSQMISLQDVSIDWDDDGPHTRVRESKPSESEKKSYDLANKTLNARFAIAAWTGAHAQGCVHRYQDMLEGERSGLELDLCHITAESELLMTYELTLMGDVTDASFMQVVRGIPVSAANVRIEQHDMEGPTDASFFALWDRLCEVRELLHFDMKLGNLSKSHSDAAFAHPTNGLGAKIGRLSKLRVLVLDVEGDTFRHKSCLSAASVDSLGRAIAAVTAAGASAFETLKIDFGGDRVFQMTSSAAIREWAANPNGSAYRTRRPSHGFGNTLSTSDVHRQRDAVAKPRPVKKEEPASEPAREREGEGEREGAGEGEGGGEVSGFIPLRRWLAWSQPPQ